MTSERWAQLAFRVSTVCLLAATIQSLIADNSDTFYARLGFLVCLWGWWQELRNHEDCHRLYDEERDER